METNTIFALGIIMAFFSALILLGIPEEYQLLSDFDFVWLSGGIVGISAACTAGASIPIFGGLVCAGALGVWGLTGVFNYIIVADEMIKLLVFTPIVLVLVYVVAAKLIKS